jgi:steroid delta-isomerase-like uncharacterized protein
MTSAGVVKQFLSELVDHQNINALDRYVADDYFEHEVLPAGLPATKEGLRQLFNLLYQAFPDLCVTIEKTIIEANTVVARLSWRGTHNKELFGLAASQQKHSFHSIEIFKIASGKITEHWSESNWFQTLQLSAQKERNV